MEMKTLLPVVLTFVMVGMILGVGVLILDKFGTQVENTVTITGESLTIASGAGQTNANYFDLSGVSFFGNSTVNDTVISLITPAVNYTASGAILVNTSKYADSTSYTISYTAKQNSTATNSVANVVDSITPISSTWLGLLVTIVILAVILTLVIRSFNMRQ